MILKKAAIKGYPQSQMMWVHERRGHERFPSHYFFRDWSMDRCGSLKTRQKTENEIRLCTERWETFGTWTLNRCWGHSDLIGFEAVNEKDTLFPFAAMDRRFGIGVDEKEVRLPGRDLRSEAITGSIANSSEVCSVFFWRSRNSSITTSVSSKTRAFSILLVVRFDLHFLLPLLLALVFVLHDDWESFVDLLPTTILDRKISALDSTENRHLRTNMLSARSHGRSWTKIEVKRVFSSRDKSIVPWLEGRQSWLGNFMRVSFVKFHCVFFNTIKHFIPRTCSHNVWTACCAFFLERNQVQRQKKSLTFPALLDGRGLCGEFGNSILENTDRNEWNNQKHDLKDVNEFTETQVVPLNLKLFKKILIALWTDFTDQA